MMNQIKKLMIPVCTLYGLMLAAMVMGPVWGKIHFNIPAELFMRDPVQLVNAAPYTGIFSNLCQLLWCAASTSCLMAWAVLKRRNSDQEWQKFFLCSGLLTAFLNFDDFFVLHDVIFPDYLGIPEKVFYVVYVTTVFSYLFRFRKTFLQTEFLLFLVAGGFLALSMGLDLIEHVADYPGKYLVEDGTKDFGILSWAIFFVRTSYFKITNSAP